MLQHYERTEEADFGQGLEARGRVEAQQFHIADTAAAEFLPAYIEVEFRDVGADHAVEQPREMDRDAPDAAAEFEAVAQFRGFESVALEKGLYDVGDEHSRGVELLDIACDRVLPVVVVREHGPVRLGFAESLPLAANAVEQHHQLLGSGLAVDRIGLPHLRRQAGVDIGRRRSDASADALELGGSDERAAQFRQARSRQVLPDHFLALGITSENEPVTTEYLVAGNHFTPRIPNLPPGCGSRGPSARLPA